MIRVDDYSVILVLTVKWIVNGLSNGLLKGLGMIRVDDYSMILVLIMWLIPPLILGD
jgi:hypothetical protein